MTAPDSTGPKVPDATVHRLSLYHCFLGELHRAEGVQRITSGRLAEELNVKEETVRRALSFVGGVGRPGAGYESDKLFAALQSFLGLSDEYPMPKSSIWILTPNSLNCLQISTVASLFSMITLSVISRVR